MLTCLITAPHSPFSQAPQAPARALARSQPQTPPNPLPNPPLELRPPLPPHLRRLHIRRTLIVRLRKHTHHTNQYLLHALNRTPPLTRRLIVIRVIARRVQYTDTHLAVSVYVGVPYLAQELHLRRVERVVARESERRGEDAAFVGGVGGAGDDGFPREHVVFGYGAGGYAVWGVREEGFVFGEEAFGRDGGGHGGRSGRGGWRELVSFVELS